MRITLADIADEIKRVVSTSRCDWDELCRWVNLAGERLCNEGSFELQWEEVDYNVDLAGRVVLERDHDALMGAWGGGTELAPLRGQSWRYATGLSPDYVEVGLDDIGFVAHQYCFPEGEWQLEARNDREEISSVRVTVRGEDAYGREVYWGGEPGEKLELNKPSKGKFVNVTGVFKPKTRGWVELFAVDGNGAECLIGRYHPMDTKGVFRVYNVAGCWGCVRVLAQPSCRDVYFETDYLPIASKMAYIYTVQAMQREVSKATADDIQAAAILHNKAKRQLNLAYGRMRGRQTRPHPRMNMGPRMGRNLFANRR